MARRNGRTRPLAIGSVITLVLIIAACVGIRAYGADDTDDYVTTTVSKGDVDQYLSLSGPLSEENQSSVGFPAAGTVTSVDVGVGDTVHAGQELATIDDTDLELAVEQAEADLASAKEQLEQAQDAADAAASASASPSASPSAQTSSAPAASTSGGTGSKAGPTGQNSSPTGGNGIGSGGTGSGGPGSGGTGGKGGSGSGGTSSGGTGSGGKGSGGTGGKGGSGSGGAAPGGGSSVQKLQQQVKADQQKLSQLLKASAAATAAQQDQCAFLGSQSSPTAPGSAPPSKSASTRPREGSSTPAPTSTPTSPSPTTPNPTSPNSTTPNPTSPNPTTPNPSTANPTSSRPSPDGPNASLSPSASAPPDQPSGRDLVACQSAMQQTADTQVAVSDEETMLARDAAALTTALQKAAGQLSSNGAAGSTPAPSSSATSGTSTGCRGAGTSGNDGSGSTTKGTSTGGNQPQQSAQDQGSPGADSKQASAQDSASAASSGADSLGQPAGVGKGSGQGTGGQGSPTTVAEAQAAVTTAEIKLNLAKQQHDQATITSPIDGVVADLDYAVGKTESTTDKIVITGSGAMALTVAVPGTKLDSIKQGQSATVGDDGSHGTVTKIGLLPSSDSSSSETSYPVTITVNDPEDDLADGATSTAKIRLAHVANVLRVPISALTTAGSLAVVTVLKDGKPQRTVVKTGAVGSTMVEITSGVSAGDQIVLADRGQPLPTSDALGTGNRRSFGSGGAIQVNGAPGGGTGKR